MAKPTVVVTRAIPGAALELLAQSAHVDANAADTAYTPEELAAHARDADAIVALLTDRIDDALLARCPRVKVVANVAVGYDNVDVAAAARRGVVVTNTPGVLTDATADFAFALLLAVARNVVPADRYVREGRFREWMMMAFHGAELGGRTLGIAGFGRIGRAVARRGRAFGMHVIYTGRRRAEAAVEDACDARFVDKETLIASSDVLSLHLPLTPQTRHFLGAPEFALMKSSAIVINTARGPVIDEAALAEALTAGAIGGAGLDVFEREPAVDPALLAAPNTVLAPHIGSATTETRTRMALTAAENVLAVLAGNAPPNRVAPPA
jgi:lactate dehydrogenase-like 2-hydroxyacid dehydrogenase